MTDDVEPESCPVCGGYPNKNTDGTWVCEQCGRAVDVLDSRGDGSDGG